MILWVKWFSETRTGDEWFLFAWMTSLDLQILFPLVQSQKVCSWGFSKAKGKVNDQIFPSVVELGPSQHHTNSCPSVHCVGTTWPCAMWVHAEQCTHCNKWARSPGHRRAPRKGTPLFRKFKYLKLHALAVATTILANDLFAGVIDSQVLTDSQVPTSPSPRLYWTCIYLVFLLLLPC